VFGVNATNRKIKAVVFDAYGTLLKITRPTHPYRTLLTMRKALGLKTGEFQTLSMLTLDRSAALMARIIVPSISPDDLNDFRLAVQDEVASIRVFDDAMPTIEALQSNDLLIGICSNLAEPYRKPVLSLFPSVDVFGFSCELNCVKPAPAIYSHMAVTLGVRSDEILFVGDTYKADYEGPCDAGMQGWHLKREGKCDPDYQIPSLLSLLPLLGIPFAGS
jgi:HAD superfamily hydrolase (TIGR01549 family)